MPSLFDLYGQNYTPAQSDAEDIDTASIISRYGRNKAYDESGFGRFANWLDRNKQQLEGASMFNPVSLALEGAGTMNKWLGASAYPERVETKDVLAPLGLGAMLSPGKVLSRDVASARVLDRMGNTPAIADPDMLPFEKMYLPMAKRGPPMAGKDFPTVMDEHNGWGRSYARSATDSDDADALALRGAATFKDASNDALGVPMSAYDRAVLDRAWRQKIARSGELFSDQSRASTPGILANAMDEPRGFNPRGAVGSAGGKLYRGAAGDRPIGSKFWMTDDTDLASQYALEHGYGAQQPMRVEEVYPRFSNPVEVDASGQPFNKLDGNATPKHMLEDGEPGFTDTESLAYGAQRAGHDGLIIRNVVDPPHIGGSAKPATVVAALQHGTVFDRNGNLVFADQSRASAPGVITNALDMSHEARMARAKEMGFDNALQEPKGITAYHGSPHDFDRFSMDKIGTGEGAQAYGHGLYFAENEGVAGAYKKKLTDRTNFVRPDGSLWSADGLEHMNVRATAYRGDIDGAIARARALAADDSPVAGHAQRDLEKLLALQASGGVKPNPGRMYEVRINADPEYFLDWDKPLSQQSEKVRSIIGNDGTDDWRGAEAYHALKDMRADAGFEGSAKADLSSALRNAGILGIRYLDQGSRTAGEGSRNYVVFDDALVEILRKYGLLGTLGAGSLFGSDESQAAP